MKKKGFTLVELLAVIAVLAILLVIALPNIVSMFNTAKKETFENEMKMLLKSAEQTWITENIFASAAKVYTRCSTDCYNNLSVSGRSNLDFYIKVNKQGTITELYSTDNNFQYIYVNDGKGHSFTQTDVIDDLEDEGDIIDIRNDFAYNAPKIFNIQNTVLAYKEGMTFEEWSKSRYNTINAGSVNYFSYIVTNNSKSATKRSATYNYFPNDLVGIRVGEQNTYNCNSTDTLYSYNYIVTPDNSFEPISIEEQIDPNMVYLVAGGSSC